MHLHVCINSFTQNSDTDTNGGVNQVEPPVSDVTPPSSVRISLEQVVDTEEVSHTCTTTPIESVHTPQEDDTSFVLETPLARFRGELIGSSSSVFIGGNSAGV